MLQLCLKRWKAEYRPASVLPPSRRSHFSRWLLSLAVGAVTSLTAVTLWAQEVPAIGTLPGPAATAPAATTPAATAPNAPSGLEALADDFMHYSIVGNEQLTKSSGEALLSSGATPVDLLNAFEAAADGRDFRTILLRNQRQANLKDVSAKLAEKVEEGYRTSSRDPKRIIADIERLDKGPRAYLNAREHLTAAGEFAGPYYIEYLRNADKKLLQPYVIRVMIEIGRPLLPPLVQQLQTPEAGQKITIIQIIGQIGYPQALPYLDAVAADKKTTEDVRKAAAEAIARIDPKGLRATGSAADAFLGLAEALYHKQPAVGPLHPTEATNPVWYYDHGLDNVAGVPVPTAIWNDVQALRAAETCLKLDPTEGKAISLWLAADIRREIDLPAGVKDPTQLEGAKDAAFYARAAGPIYLNPVLSMAMADRDRRWPCGRSRRSKRPAGSRVWSPRRRGPPRWCGRWAIRIGRCVLRRRSRWPGPIPSRNIRAPIGWCRFLPRR